MGILTKHEKSNYEETARVIEEYRGYGIEFRLVEYDVYERIFCFRETRRMQSIAVSAYDNIGEDDVWGEKVTSQRYAWREGSITNTEFEFNVNQAFAKVKRQIDEREGRQDDLEEVVKDGWFENDE